MHSSGSDMQEEAFVRCLQEIERSYVHLPKSLRIRTEKWIEKLVATGSNIVWRKHRNAYARLLLNMVVTKTFSEPFHVLPPEGPLPSFPAHVKAFQKDLIGPHETKFWRELYQRAKEVIKENPSNDAINSSILAVNAADSAVLKEVRNLNLLIREQAVKIDQLEQQIKHERMQYELEIQRLHLLYRGVTNPSPSAPHHPTLPVPKVSDSPSFRLSSRAYEPKSRSLHPNALSVSSDRLESAAMYDFVSSHPNSAKGSVSAKVSVSSFPLMSSREEMMHPAALGIGFINNHQAAVDNAEEPASTLAGSPRSVPVDIMPMPKALNTSYNPLPIPPTKLNIGTDRYDLPSPAAFSSSRKTSTDEQEDADGFLDYIDNFQKKLQRVQQERAAENYMATASSGSDVSDEAI
ncbi:DUF4485 domain-containing protein [archaeon]|nr:MAG: DUF4485 domain-containing protein [archaeon]